MLLTVATEITVYEPVIDGFDDSRIRTVLE
jgi:hypothetical protein